jgi:PadR family transcriptional regulator, regulatory protein AphA
MLVWRNFKKLSEIEGQTIWLQEGDLRKKGEKIINVYMILSEENLMSLQYAILGLLTYTSITGYNLKTLFDKSINHFWKASLSQIYRELSALEEKGYVTSNILPQEDRPDKRVYNITGEGEKAFHEWLIKFPEILSGSNRDEFMVRIFFGSKLGDNELKQQLKRYIEERKNVEKTIDEIKKHFGRLIEQKENGKTTAIELEKEVRYWRFTVKRMRILNEASIRWAEECIKELDEVTES